MKNNNIERATWGNFFVEKEIPMIEICINEKVEGYLSAFRGYKFQVSATRDGQYDLGSSWVIGLGNLNSVPVSHDSEKDWLYRSNLNKPNIDHYLIECVAMRAVVEFCERRDVFAPSADYPAFNVNAEWKKFIDAVYDMIH